MFLFERFIARANTTAEEFFKAAGITNTDELRAYCAQKGMTFPVKEYFVEKEASLIKKVVKPKVVASKIPLKEKTKPKEVVKKPRTTRRKSKTKSVE